MSSAWDTLSSLASLTDAASQTTALPPPSAWSSSQAAHLARSRAASRAAFHVDALARAREKMAGLRREDVVAATAAARGLETYFAGFVGGTEGEVSEEAMERRKAFVRSVAGAGAVGGGEKGGGGMKGEIVVDQALHEGICAFWKEGAVRNACSAADQEAEWIASWKLTKEVVDANFSRNAGVLRDGRDVLGRMRGASELLKQVWLAEAPMGIAGPDTRPTVETELTEFVEDVGIAQSYTSSANTEAKKEAKGADKKQEVERDGSMGDDQLACNSVVALGADSQVENNLGMRHDIETYHAACPNSLLEMTDVSQLSPADKSLQSPSDTDIAVKVGDIFASGPALQIENEMTGGKKKSRDATSGKCENERQGVELDEAPTPGDLPDDRVEKFKADGRADFDKFLDDL